MFECNSYFITDDKIKLEIIFYEAINPKANIVIWPCMGGNARLYRISYKRLIDYGYSIILYNPRSHGRSTGQMSLTSGIDDIISFLRYKKIDHLPFIGVGHSAGCSCLLKLGLSISNIKNFFLISPILDSRESLSYMYKKNTIDEFSMLIASRVTDKPILDSILSTNQWLDIEYWLKYKIKEQLNSISSNLLVGQFFEEICMPGFNVKNELIQFKTKTQIFLHSLDNWFPLEVTKKLAEQHNIPVKVISEAKDHFFQKAVTFLWNHIDSVLMQ